MSNENILVALFTVWALVGSSNCFTRKEKIKTINIIKIDPVGSIKFSCFFFITEMHKHNVSMPKANTSIQCSTKSQFMYMHANVLTLMGQIKMKCYLIFLLLNSFSSFFMLCCFVFFLRIRLDSVT